jgi:hypothetical protein
LQIPIQGPNGKTFAIPINCCYNNSSWNLYWYNCKDLQMEDKSRIVAFLIEPVDQETCKLLTQNKDKAKQVTLEFFQWLGKDTSKYLLWYNTI